MPDESCRCCGGSLTDRKVCKKCFQSTSEACTECGNHTLEKFHVMCNLSDNNSEFVRLVSAWFKIKNYVFVFPTVNHHL